MTLLTDGDVFEQKYYSLFLSSRFPHYEQFWMKFIVPLTQRTQLPASIHAKEDADLVPLNRGPKDVCISQLSYTAFKHVARVYDLKSKAVVDFDEFTEGLARLSSALDVAFELLQRATSTQPYNVWDEQAGRQARSAWQSANNRPLQHIKDYRNRLSHGHIVPCFSLAPTPSYQVPKIGKEELYLDWRKVTNAPPSSLPTADFDTPKNVLSGAWDEVVNYLDDRWKNVLLNVPVPAAPPGVSLVPPMGSIVSSAGSPQSAPAASGQNTASGTGMTASGMGSGANNAPAYSGYVPISGAVPAPPPAGSSAAGSGSGQPSSNQNTPQKTGCAGILLLVGVVIEMGRCWWH